MIENGCLGESLTEKQMESVTVSATTENIKNWFKDATSEDVGIMASWLVKNFNEIVKEL